MAEQYRYEPGDPDTAAADVPSGAGIWNFWGGGQHFTSSEERVGRALQEQHPDITAVARHSRDFQARVIAAMTGAGIRQILDVGTGLPMPLNTHDMAGQDTTVVYVDNDQLVLRYADAFMTGARTAYLHADLTDPENVLALAEDYLDLSAPVGMLCLSTLSSINPPTRAAAVVRGYTARLAAGSMLAVCDTLASPRVRAVEAEYEASGTTPYIARTREEILACADGLDVLPPGLVPVTHWPHGADEDRSHQHGFLARVGREAT